MENGHCSLRTEKEKPVSYTHLDVYKRQVVDGKKVTVYDEVDKTIKKDMPSRLHARRQMLKVLYPCLLYTSRCV